MKVTIERVYLPTETLGSWYVDGQMITKTMELPWKNNARNVSCIPEGSYRVVREASSARHQYPHFRILNVRGRDGILVHKITYVSGLQGCIGVGEFKDLNGDNVPDMINSGLNLQKLYDMMPDEFTLEIKAKPQPASLVKPVKAAVKKLPKKVKKVPRKSLATPRKSKGRPR